MSFLNRLGIAHRLYGVVFILAIALCAVAAITYVRLTAVNEAAEHAESQRVAQLNAVAAVELNVTRVSLQLRHAMLARNAEELRATLADVGDKRKAIDDTLAGFEKRLFSDAGKASYAKLLPVVTRFWQVGEANVALITAGRKEEAFAFLVDKTIPARNDLLKVLEEAVQIQADGLKADIDGIQRRVDATMVLQITVFAAIIAALVAMAWYIGSALRRRVTAAQTVAERVRDGDLTTPVANDTHDEFAPLLGALGAMQTSLSRIVSDVRVSAESVATASAEIAQGNQDLSSRTEHQASALQQTSATMNELGTTVRHNADNAQQANQLAVTASSRAAQGGNVVSQVVETMHGINESSRKIADIISVIDGIAFQTNILALNAAVEAARAGEQGRGFAVVAGEVRNLAQRSAQAAREIKSLITTSVERVEQGSALVAQAGSTMDEIVDAISRVTTIVEQITAASRQQSEGVGQVGEAITQMDQTTQQNAALVEQSAAAASNLKTQATQLVQAMAVFRVGHGAALQPA